MRKWAEHTFEDNIEEICKYLTGIGCVLCVAPINFMLSLSQQNHNDQLEHAQNSVRHLDNDHDEYMLQYKESRRFDEGYVYNI